jgi:lipid A ethanolaminephosphotransferase
MIPRTVFDFDGKGSANPFQLTPPRLVVLTSVFLAVFHNYAFFRSLVAVYPATLGKLPFLFSVFLALVCATALPLIVFSSRNTLKPVLISVLAVSSVASYFMNTFNVVIDVGMIRNVVQTDAAESMDLINFRLLAYFLFLGVLPSAWIYGARVQYGSLKTEAVSKLKYMAALVLVLLATGIAFSGNYYSFFREHKEIRVYANPGAWMFSTARYALGTRRAQAKAVHPIGMDAAIPASDIDRELIILVVGEAARADRFSLNGYGRETNPLLAKEDVISFTDFQSCGTSTAVSVPCMFSVFGRKDYSEKKFRETENLLDVLRHAGVNVLWRDNNSSSKGVADRVAYEDFRTPRTNPSCDVECRDEGMLAGLQDYIDRTKRGDILIVLHQMGNHGPAYYKRYPKRYEKFTPVCDTNRLEECTDEQIGNAYDDAILYTDYFLSRVVELLKRNTGKFETAMLYVGDHGESLGENRIYLHGLPYFMAPESQKHVPAILWLGESFGTDRKSLRAKAHLPFSHDNLFHTILGMMEIRTSVYKKDLDILNAGP